MQHSKLVSLLFLINHTREEEQSHPQIATLFKKIRPLKLLKVYVPISIHPLSCQQTLSIKGIKLLKKIAQLCAQIKVAQAMNILLWLQNAKKLKSQRMHVGSYVNWTLIALQLSTINQELVIAPIGMPNLLRMMVSPALTGVAK